MQRAVFTGTTSAHPTSLLVNPSALALGLDGWYVHAGGSGAVERLRVRRRIVDPDSGALLSGPQNTSTMLSPGFNVGFYKVGARISAGLQIGLPIAEDFHEGKDNWGYHTRGGVHREYAAVFGGAYRWRGLAFGTSLFWVRSGLRLAFDRDTALERGAVDGVGFENPDAREHYIVRVGTGWLPSAANTIAVMFGAVVKVTEGWTVGASYHVPQGLFSGLTATGDVQVTRAPNDGAAEETITGEATVRFRLPWRLRVGVRGRLAENLDIVAETRWERTSDFAAYDLRMYGLELSDAEVPEIYPRPRGLRDQLALQAGVEQVDTGGRALLGGRIGVERGYTADARLSPLNARPFALTADAGVQLRLDPSWTLQLGGGVAWSPTTDSGRGDYDPIQRLDCIDAGFDIDHPACETVRRGYGLPTASGVYQRVGGVAWVGLKWARP